MPWRRPRRQGRPTRLWLTPCYRNCRRSTAKTAQPQSPTSLRRRLLPVAGDFSKLFPRAISRRPQRNWRGQRECPCPRRIRKENEIPCPLHLYFGTNILFVDHANDVGAPIRPKAIEAIRIALRRM